MPHRSSRWALTWVLANFASNGNFGQAGLTTQTAALCVSGIWVLLTAAIKPAILRTRALQLTGAMDQRAGPHRRSGPTRRFGPARRKAQPGSQRDLSEPRDG